MSLAPNHVTSQAVGDRNASPITGGFEKPTTQARQEGLPARLYAPINNQHPAYTGD